MICPNNNGGYDCTPFCELCAGEQELRRYGYECFKCSEFHELDSTVSTPRAAQELSAQLGIVVREITE